MAYIDEIRNLRNKIGCGLREAKDAIDRYGTCEKAMAALDPNLPTEQKDPFARLTEESARWSNKAAAYKNGLIRIKNHPDFDALPAVFQRYVQEAIVLGESQ